ncbi:MAG: glyoxalase [Pseudonocardiales bacterium]|nr:glyoxalase [Pseudonocardiales bacterium]
MITGYDHVQVAIPQGGEDLARTFYGGLLQMTEQPKPTALAGRGGCWFTAGAAVFHLGVEEPFQPAAKAHPAFVVTDLERVRTDLETAGHRCIGSAEIEGVQRFHTHDPFGNRLEFQQA